MSKKVILIFVVILIVLGISAIFIFNKKNREIPPELPPVFSIVGEITNITESGFQVKTLKDQNSFGIDKEFFVFMASSTVFSNIEMPQTISEENAQQPILAKKIKCF